MATEFFKSAKGFVICNQSMNVFTKEGKVRKVWVTSIMPPAHYKKPIKVVRRLTQTGNNSLINKIKKQHGIIQ